jgi:ABC-type uncharacterized transport system YnjBCD ATPase subunit
MGVLPAQTGSITLAEQELRGRLPYVIARRGVAFVPEDREVFVTLTVEENLHLARRRGSEGATVAKVYSLFPDLHKARHRSAGALSGGQQQMLAIGRALVNPNRILLVDEPTKGLAPVIVKDLRAIFTALPMVGAALVRYLNHYLNVLATATFVSALPNWLHGLLGRPLLIFGVIYLLLVFFFPAGIAGLVQRRGHPGRPVAPQPGLAKLEPEAGGTTVGGEDTSSP